MTETTASDSVFSAEQQGWTGNLSPATWYRHRLNRLMRILRQALQQQLPLPHHWEPAVLRI